MASRNASVERFRQLGRTMQVECLEIAKSELAAQAERLVGVMRQAVPVKSGALRKSIGWTFGNPPATRATGAFRPKPKAGKAGQFRVTVYAGDDTAFYARWVEFGTAPHAVGRGSRVGKRQGGRQVAGVKAHPFFYPSYRLLKKTMVATIKRKLTAAIKKRSAR